MERGACLSEAKRSWSYTILWAADGWQDKAAVNAGGRLPIIKEIDLRLATQLPGKPAEEHTPHRPLDKLAVETF